jgi:GH24 family phage-related lysozyme (muramidase)
MNILTRLRTFARSLAVEPRKPAPLPNGIKAANVALNATVPTTAKSAVVQKASDELKEVVALSLANEAKVNALPPVTHRKTGKAGIDLMHAFEGCEKRRPDGRFEAYLCPAKVWTIGWGATGADPFNGGKIGKGTIWTQEQCDMRFEQHLAQFEAAVREGIGKAATSQAQFDAMVAWTYNVGIGAMRKSTLLRMHKAGDFDGAAKQFLRWNRAGGKILRGLTRRREAESALYLSGSARP